jgi:hypothetical protein
LKKKRERLKTRSLKKNAALDLEMTEAVIAGAIVTAETTAATKREVVTGIMSVEAEIAAGRVPGAGEMSAGVTESVIGIEAGEIGLVSRSAFSLRVRLSAKF